MWYTIDEVDQGIAYTSESLKTGTWYPTFSLWTKEQQIQMINPSLYIHTAQEMKEKIN